MTKIVKHYTINVPVKKVWAALTKPKIIKAWGAGPRVKMRAQVGSEFKLWGGSIYGENTEVVAEKRLVQDWYGGDWEEPSEVVINLKKLKNKTKINLIHTNVPKNEIKSFETGWDDFYFGPMKTYLEAKYQPKNS